MKRKGFTLVELLVATGVMGLLITGVMTVFASSMHSFYRTETDIDLANQGSLGMQRVADSLRGAYGMEVMDSGNKVTYTMPLISNVVDPITGEREIFDPLQGDGVVRSFSVREGKLYDDFENRVLMDDIVLIDPRSDSSQFEKTYAPFQLTTIGSRRALTITFITAEQVLGEPRYSRMKTTVIIRNSI